jgi:hypothetical protein
VFDTTTKTYNIDKKIDYFTIRSMVIQCLENIIREELNDKDNSVINRCYIDSEPFLSDGSLRNNYRLYSEWIDHGNGEKYKEVVNWAGGVPITVRIDGWDSVDFYALNAREIIVPASVT